eukprot:7693837-Pyramimonas_sp.AAC.1
MRRPSSVRRAICTSSHPCTPAGGSGRVAPGCSRLPGCLQNRGVPRCGTRRSCRKHPSVAC